MRRGLYIFLGFVVGLSCSVAVPVFAESFQNMVGKTVEQQVSISVDGKTIDAPALIVEGTSYAPIRAIGEVVGREVDWKDGVVILNKKSAISDLLKEMKEANEKASEIQEKIDSLSKEVVDIDKKMYSEKKDDLSVEEYETMETEHRNKLAKIESLRKEQKQYYDRAQEIGLEMSGRVQEGAK